MSGSPSPPPPLPPKRPPAGRFTSSSKFRVRFTPCCAGDEEHVWVAPRQCICALVWSATFCIFVGLIVFVQGRHVDPVYSPVGLTLTGLGIGIFMVALVLCIRGYAVAHIGDESVEQGDGDSAKSERLLMAASSPSAAVKPSSSGVVGCLPDTAAPPQPDPPNSIPLVSVAHGTASRTTAAQARRLATTGILPNSPDGTSPNRTFDKSQSPDLSETSFTLPQPTSTVSPRPRPALPGGRPAAATLPRGTTQFQGIFSPPYLGYPGGFPHTSPPATMPYPLSYPSPAAAVPPVPPHPLNNNVKTRRARFRHEEAEDIMTSVDTTATEDVPGAPLVTTPCYENPTSRVPGLSPRQFDQGDHDEDAPLLPPRPAPAVAAPKLPKRPPSAFSPVKAKEARKPPPTPSISTSMTASMTQTEGGGTLELQTEYTQTEYLSSSKPSPSSSPGHSTTVCSEVDLRPVYDEADDEDEDSHQLQPALVTSQTPATHEEVRIRRLEERLNHLPALPGNLTPVHVEAVSIPPTTVRTVTRGTTNIARISFLPQPQGSPQHSTPDTPARSSNFTGKFGTIDHV